MHQLHKEQRLKRAVISGKQEEILRDLKAVFNAENHKTTNNVYDWK
jgi:hypothetical protein